MSTTDGACGASNFRESAEAWHWQGEEYCLRQDADFAMSGCQWSEATLNAEDVSYMLDDETTPVKACGDLAYHASHCGDVNKGPIEFKETSSQVKRRRMLQFDNQVADSSLCCNEMPSAFLKLNVRGEPVEEVLPEASQWVSCISGDVSASCYEDLDESFDGWFAECFNNAETDISSDDMNISGASSVQIHISEFGNSPPACNTNSVQQCVTQTPQNVVFKGGKSFIRTPTKSASSVAYPFAFIKPCGIHGAVTLKDINQRIHTPPSNSKQNIEGPSAYPTSAFSGKPVVGKTKIHTEGGKGSITIMRTRG
ncbi:protein XRI1-like [Mangifera indica]|uniref:protein XRI1-like n=1 Tax=Mangifera indica TaxID=29780 RepID=UPI001CFAFB83|nr:protein XRI1-like [Mangifera indica]